MNDKRIDGKKIAEEILENLHQIVQKEHLSPGLVVFLVGDNPSSQSYIRQKQIAAERIGARFTLKQFSASITDNEFNSQLQIVNNNHSVHGIIIQRPLPQDATITPSTVDSILPGKDIDGLLPHSPFEVPVAYAVVTVLEKIYDTMPTKQHTFLEWIRSQNIAVIGKGVTAGKPIREALEKLIVPLIGIDSSTQRPHDLTKKADIIISCVGKEQTVTSAMIKKDSILLSVGLTKGADGKIHGDFEEDDIKDKVLRYMPTPGGIGPVNVACLMQNLVKAATIK